MDFWANISLNFGLLRSMRQFQHRSIAEKMYVAFSKNGGSHASWKQNKAVFESLFGIIVHF